MMKSFEERKNEILSRSEKRIEKRRKKLRRLPGMALCLLILVAGTVAIYPRAENDGATANGAVYQEKSTENETTEVKMESGAESPEEMPELYQYDVTGLEEGGVDLEITQIDTDANTLTMALTNYSCQQITYSPWFDIEQQTENGWVSCAEEDMSWECVLYILGPGDTATETYWMGSFDLSEPGMYRFVMDCNLYVEEDSTPFRVMTEFAVEETP